MSTAAEEVTASSDEMVKSIESVKAITEETTASTEQMAAHNYEVQQSMDQINEITQESGEAIEQSSASAEELSSQFEEVVASATSLDDMAVNLNGAVGRFKLDEDTGQVESTSPSLANSETIDEELAAYVLTLVCRKKALAFLRGFFYSTSKSMRSSNSCSSPLLQSLN